jgi:hypothetical protein
VSRWGFLTNHARVLVCLAELPGCRLREVADSVQLTERATHRIVDELVQAEYVTRHRLGNRNFYEVHADRLLRDGDLPEGVTNGRPATVGELLAHALGRG